MPASGHLGPAGYGLLLLPALLRILLPLGLLPFGLPATAVHGAWPLEPRPEVAETFQPPATLYGTGHRGVDLVGHPGQLVHTALAGTVRYAGRLAGRGVVVVDHGDTRTTYEPVRASVHVGDRVATGAVIGALEAAPSHCMPRTCLHWGLIRGDTYLDPLTLVGGGPVRLLPLTGALEPASPIPVSAALGWDGRAFAPSSRQPTLPAPLLAAPALPPRTPRATALPTSPSERWPASRFARPL